MKRLLYLALWVLVVSWSPANAQVAIPKGPSEDPSQTLPDWVLQNESKNARLQHALRAAPEIRDRMRVAAAPDGLQVCRIDAVSAALEGTRWAPPVEEVALDATAGPAAESLEALRALNATAGAKWQQLLDDVTSRETKLARITQMRCAARTLSPLLLTLESAIAGNRPWPSLQVGTVLISVDAPIPIGKLEGAKAAEPTVDNPELAALLKKVQDLHMDPATRALLEAAAQQKKQTNAMGHPVQTVGVDSSPWRWFAAYYDLAYGVQLNVPSDPSAPGRALWLGFEPGTRVCDRSADQGDRIAAQRAAQRTCWQNYMSRVSQGAKADGSSCGPAFGIVPRTGVCLGMDGRGSGCEDDPDSTELPYFKLERRAVELQDVNRTGTAQQTRTLREKVDALEVTLSGIEVEGLRNAQRTLVALSAARAVHTDWLALEAARLEQAYVLLRREISTIRALDSRLAGLRAEYDRLRLQVDSAARTADTLAGKAKQLRSDLDKASAALSTDASRADVAMAATRRLNGADRAGYEAMASSEDLLTTFSQNLTRMRTTADGLFGTMQDLTAAKARLFEVSTSKATLAFEIEAIAEESRRRHAAADIEQARLDALALARNRDEQLATQRAERLRTSQALQAGACSRTLRRVPE